MSGLRIIDLSMPATVLLDIVAWFVIHMGVVITMVSLPLRLFDPQAWPFRPRAWERRGWVYETLLRVRVWKDLLPDGADWFRWRSFRKSTLERRDRPYLERFARETCRAEATHLLTMVWAPLFFLWNPVWVGWLMIVYAVVENLPVMVAQRYNRVRFERVLDRDTMT